jgi:ribonuclease PH
MKRNGPRRRPSTPPSRDSQQIRAVRIQRNFTRTSAASVLYQCGGTTVLCTASIDDKVPDWMATADRGWVTAEYNMLPGSTSPRRPRERAKLDGRTTEIQRLIGRSLRSVIDLAGLGPRQITLDCDVLEADGGTRTASITGAFIALVDALHSIRDSLHDPDALPLRDSVAAISVGIVDGKYFTDLDYALDVEAEVDMNIVMTGSGRFVEIQGTGEETTFSDRDLSALLKLARGGIEQLTKLQAKALGSLWPKFGR